VCINGRLLEAVRPVTDDIIPYTDFTVPPFTKPVTTFTEPPFSVSWPVTSMVPINPNDCNNTLAGYTWLFDPEIDQAIPGLPSANDCAEKCLAFPWCMGYTWTIDDAAGSICHLFHELNNLHPCHDCSDCMSGMFYPITGVCNPNHADDILATYDAYSELECVDLCAATQDCKYYSWGNGNIFTNNNKCYLFKTCTATDTCESWESGQMACFGSGTNADQCKNYKILNDKDRNIENDHTPQLCDRSQANNVSPDWQGHNWYRIMAPAGTMMPTQSPGGAHCGSSASGWMIPTDIDQFGQTVATTVCFASSNNECWQKRSINVTLCADTNEKYYVYQLPDSYNCNYKYCAQ